ncbi:MFS transporter [Rouxiella badensis]|uniref:MFS transporter n=1 Tax=Rouxiella badensis TaxID=1646377 RepID=UPI001D155791|nr:MFS transporter [Rouxiella badensis]MCC3745435.1 MFS transporter [Rouxiella badensis]
MQQFTCTQKRHYNVVVCNFEVAMNDNQMTRQESRATWGLGTVFSLRMLGMFMVLPVLTTYGMSLAGASETLIGIAIGIYGLAQAIFQIPFGLLSDRIGRKPLIVFGLLIFTAGSVIAASTHSIWGVIIGRALQGSGAIAAAVMALMSDLTREQNRTKAMAFIGISFGITFAIAMVLGPIITHAWGLHALFWAIAVLTLCGIVITLTVVPSPATHLLNRESSVVKGSFGKVLTNGKLLKLNFGILCLHILLMSSFVVLPQVMEKAGFPPSEHWRVYLVTMLTSFVAVIPVIIYAEKKRHMKQVFMGCVAVLLLAELVLWAAGLHLWAIITGIQLFFLAFNVMEAILPSLISKESPAGYKGTAMGLYSTSQFIGVAIGGSLGGFIFGHAGASAVFMACAAIAVVWFFVSATMSEPPYVSSLRITLSEDVAKDATLATRMKSQPGVADVVVVAEELSAYVKVDTKQTNRQALEAFVSQA